MSAHRLWMKSGASGRAVDLNHPAIHDHRDNHGKDAHGKADEKCFHCQ